MAAIGLRVSDVPALGPGFRKMGFSCPHGASSALLLPGRTSVSDLVVLDILLARHYRTQGCACAPRMPADPGFVAIA